MRLLLVVALLVSLLVVAAVPCSASGWQDKLGAVAVVAPNDGAALGAGLSYQCNPHLWADLFGKREVSDESTKVAAGLSTDLERVAQIIGGLLNLNVPSVPKGAAVGAALDTTGGMIFYGAFHIGF